jgi:hypothetical protein
VCGAAVLAVLLQKVNSAGASSSVLILLVYRAAVLAVLIQEVNSAGASSSVLISSDPILVLGAAVFGGAPTRSQPFSSFNLVLYANKVEVRRLDFLKEQRSYTQSAARQTKPSAD